MKIEIHDWYTDITLTPEEMKHLCTPGEGADTCVWLVLGASGFECTYLNKPPTLTDKWRKEETIAKRDGCDFVKSINPMELGSGKHKIKVPGITK